MLVCGHGFFAPGMTAPVLYVYFLKETAVHSGQETTFPLPEIDDHPVNRSHMDGIFSPAMTSPLAASDIQKYFL